MSTADTARDMDLVRRIAGRRAGELLRRVVRLGAGRDLGLDVPRHRPRRRRRRRARPGRLDHRARPRPTAPPAPACPAAAGWAARSAPATAWSPGWPSATRPVGAACRLAGDALARWDAVAARLRSDKRGRVARIGAVLLRLRGHRPWGCSYGGDLDFIARTSPSASRSQLARAAGRPPPASPPQADGSLRAACARSARTWPTPRSPARTPPAAPPAVRPSASGSTAASTGCCAPTGSTPPTRRPGSRTPSAPAPRAAPTSARCGRGASSACAAWPGSARTPTGVRSRCRRPSGCCWSATATTRPPRCRGALALQRLMPGSRLVVTRGHRPRRDGHQQVRHGRGARLPADRPDAGRGRRVRAIPVAVLTSRLPR